MPRISNIPLGSEFPLATKTYSGLSEFSHPNCYAFINHFEWEADLRNLPKVTFGKPSRNQLVMCLPAASMAVVTFLNSSAKLVGSIEDGELFETIEKMIEAMVKNHSRADHTAA
jgi:hypothetical protein